MERRVIYVPPRGECIGIVSGKGGTGKSVFAMNTGAALARMGKRVLCVDCDTGLRGLDIALGLSDASAMNFADAAMGRCDLREAIIEYPMEPGLFLLNAPAGLIETWDPDRLTKSGMENLISQIRNEFDICFLDAPPGMGFGFTLATLYASRVIVVALMDAVSLRDAQRVVMDLNAFPDGDVHLVVNRVRRGMLARTRMTIDDAMDQAGLPLLGLIPEDDAVPLALHKQQPVTLAYPSSRAASAFRNIAGRITGKAVPLAETGWRTSFL